MITIRTANAPNGQIIFQMQDTPDRLFKAEIELAVEMFTNGDIRELINRAYAFEPHTHMLVRMEHGLPMEIYMSFRNPFVTMFRSNVVDDHILVVYTILHG